MCKIRLISIALLTITYLMTPVAFSQPPAPKTQTPTLPILSPDEFKQTVTQMNAKTQQQLDATLASLLGSSPSTGAGSMMSSPAAASIKSTPSQPETSTVTSSPQTTTSPTTTAPVSQGFNPYAN